ncbi:MAG: LysR family transcriptional regulator [Sedimentisphaerales bacterium]|nr:LysR family transcriptional regulator [Sedimentisphaerales bacterium]
MKNLRAKFRLWFNSKKAEGGFGDGKWRLLNEINNNGSLRAASEVLGISYRKAWGDLKNAERVMQVQLVDKHRGGREGGQTVLSKQGKKWVKAYELFRRDVEKAVEAAYAKHIKGFAE